MAASPGPPPGLPPPTAPPPSSSPPPLARSFAAVAAGRSLHEEVNITSKISDLNGIPFVDFEFHDLCRAANSFSKALVMKFAHFQRPSVDLIRFQARKNWGLQNDVKISLLDSRHVLLRFLNEHDMVKILSKESSKINGASYRIFRWSPEFDPKHDASIAPVWVQLKDFPPHMYHASFLKNISKPIGQYLRSDSATISLSNTTRARFCVEVDLLKPLPTQIWVRTARNKKILQSVLYEEIPKFCISCKMQGHNEAFCHKLHPELKNKKEKHQEEVEDGKARKKIDCREEEEKEKSEENEANMAGKTAHEVFEEMPEPIKAIETAENEKIIDDGNIVRDSVIVIASEETGDSSDDPTLVANTKLDDQDNDGQSSMKNNTIFVYNEEGIDLVAELFVNPLDVSKSGEMVQESPGYEKEFPSLGIENGKKKIDDENNFELDVAEIDEAECNNPIAIESPIQRGLTLDEDRVGSPDDEVLVPNSQVQLVNEANILLARLEGKPNKKNKEDLNTRKLVAKISKSKIALLPAGPLKEKLATTHLGG